MKKLLRKRPSFNEKIEMLRRDVNTEGKKKGHVRAAKEYGKAYRIVEKEFKKTKDLLEDQKNTHETQIKELTELYNHLKQLSTELKRQVDLKANEISLYYDIPREDIHHKLNAGTLLVNFFTTYSILSLIYNYKQKKLHEAENQGYIEAKNIHEEKIDNLKTELERLKKDANKDIQQLLSLISEILDDIAKEQTKVSELTILL